MPWRLIAVLLLGLLATVSVSATEPGADAKILLQNSPLAGFRYYEGKRLWSEMKVGDTLQPACSRTRQCL
jgi:hypothetical protein